MPASVTDVHLGGIRHYIDIHMSSGIYTYVCVGKVRIAALLAHGYVLPTQQTLLPAPQRFFTCSRSAVDGHTSQVLRHLLGITVVDNTEDGGRSMLTIAIVAQCGRKRSCVCKNFCHIHYKRHVEALCVSPLRRQTFSQFFLCVAREDLIYVLVAKCCVWDSCACDRHVLTFRYSLAYYEYIPQELFFYHGNTNRLGRAAYRVAAGRRANTCQAHSTDAI